MISSSSSSNPIKPDFVLANAEDCHAKCGCSDDEACKYDKNGCECWTPGSDVKSPTETKQMISSSSSSNPIKPDFVLANAEDCHAKCGCSDDEACKYDKNGCECWTPGSDVKSPTDTKQMMSSSSFDSLKVSSLNSQAKTESWNFFVFAFMPTVLILY